MATLDQDPKAVLAPISSRRNIRAFLDRPVHRWIIEEILAAASRAPSGNNGQPWRVHALTGPAKARLSAAILGECASGAPEPAREYHFYPEEWAEPHPGRRREVGRALYRLLGILKDDRASACAWHDRNFTFFDAPAGIILTTVRRPGLAALIDIGMFLEALIVAGRVFGLETRIQPAFGAYHAIVCHELALAPEEMVVCGLSLGFENRDALPHQLRTTRLPVEDFTTFHAD